PDHNPGKSGLHPVHPAYAALRQNESGATRPLRPAAGASGNAHRRAAVRPGGRPRPARFATGSDPTYNEYSSSVPKKRPFGVSTHLYHGHRLTRDHLLEIGAYGFESVELFATRSHFDYHSSAAVADLQQWLAEAGLELHSVHAPIFESFS